MCVNELRRHLSTLNGTMHAHCRAQRRHSMNGNYDVGHDFSPLALFFIFHSLFSIEEQEK